MVFSPLVSIYFRIECAFRGGTHDKGPVLRPGWWFRSRKLTVDSSVAHLQATWSLLLLFVHYLEEYIQNYLDHSPPFIQCPQRISDPGMMNFDYTNPGFCISETYTPPAKIQRHDPNFRSVREKRSVFRVAAAPRPQNLNNTFNGLAMQPQLPPKPGPKPVGLSTMIHSNKSEGLGAVARDKNGQVMRSQSFLDHRATSIEAIPMVHQPQSLTNQTSSGRYALVPIEEVPAAQKDRYEILPLQTAAKIFHKSHDQM